MLFRAFIIFIALFIGSAQVQALEPDEIFAQVSKSIVVVVALHEDDRVTVASGVITEAGQIATSCHVVQDAVRVAVLRESYKSTGVVRFSDPERDLCQLTVVDTTGFETPVRELVNAKNLRVGQIVYALGMPQGLDLTLSDGVISSLRETELGQIIQSNTSVSQISIGGGLFDSEARLVGITTSISPEEKNVNLAISADRILELQSREAARVKTRKAQVAERSRRLEEERTRAEDAQRAV